MLSTQPTNALTAETGINNSRRGEICFGTPGTYTWTVPAGVTSISAIVIGSGGAGIQRGTTAPSSGMQGGSAGGLCYINNYPVLPGQTYTIIVGAGGTVRSHANITGTNGATSELRTNLGTAVIVAHGGATGTHALGFPGRVGTNTPTGPGGSGGTVVSYLGGVGGTGGSTSASGGGGVAGYLGNGAVGGTSSGPGFAPTAGSGAGAGGAPGQSATIATSGFGGSVGLYGVGFTGKAANGTSTTVNGENSGGGSNGGGALGNTNYGFGQTLSAVMPVGVGGCASRTTLRAGPGGNGAARIVWPGDTRQFPGTDVGDAKMINTWIRGSSSYPASRTINLTDANYDIKVGDLVVICYAFQRGTSSPSTSLSPLAPFTLATSASPAPASGRTRAYVWWGRIESQSQITTYTQGTTSYGLGPWFVITRYRFNRAVSGVRLIQQNSSQGTTATAIPPAIAPGLPANNVRNPLIFWAWGTDGVLTSNGGMADSNLKLTGGNTPSTTHVEPCIHQVSFPETSLVAGGGLGVRILSKCYERQPTHNPRLTWFTAGTWQTMGYLYFEVF